MAPVAALALALGLGAGLFQSPERAGSFERARAAERAALEAEREALREALSEARRTGASARAKLDAKARALTAELTRVEAEASRLALDAVQRSEIRASETEAEHFADLAKDVDAWLGARDLAAPGGREAEVFPRQLEAVLASLLETAGVREQLSDEVFDASGRPQKARLLRIGEVGAVAAEGEGVYARSADGYLEVPGLAAKRRSLDDGLVSVTAWIQDPDVPFDASAAKHGWRDTLRQGGPLMWVLGLFAVVGALVALERLVVLGLAYLRRRRLEAHLEGEGRSHPSPAALERAGGPLAAPIVAARGRGELEARESKAVSALRELQDRLTRRLSVLSLLSGAAPLVGLLGTVSGMIQTFSVVTDKGSADPQAMAGGISEALLTTQYGLAVAIPLLLLHVLLSRGARRMVAFVEAAAVSALFAADASGPGEGAGDA